ncbi:MAG: ATPase, T2SS/T4P/T4SS family [Caldilineaceae bacterium]
MALFRSKAPAAKTVQPGAVLEAVAPKKIESAKAVPEKVAAKPEQKSASGNNFLNELGIYTLPSELKTAFRKVREDVQRYLVDENIGSNTAPNKLREIVEPVYTRALTDANIVVSRVDRTRMLDMIIADIVGFGPIQPLLDRDDITEVMVNGPSQIYIEHKGKLHLTDVKFLDDDHVNQVIERIVAPLGRRIDESSPMVDARLPDGSRVNAIIPPLSLVGPSLTIRKFRKDPFKVEDLIRFGSFPQNLENCCEPVSLAS